MQHASNPTRQVAIWVGVQDDRGERLQKAAATNRLIAAQTDLDSARAVVTESPLDHLEMIQRGGHQLTIDPFLVEPDMISVMGSSGRSMPAVMLRFEPAMVQLKKALLMGELGEPRLIRIHAWANTQQSPKQGLAEQLDLVMWLIGSVPSSVYGVLRDGLAQAHLDFASGATALIDTCTKFPGEACNSLTLVGTQATAQVDSERRFQLFDEKGEGQNVQGKTGPELAASNGDDEHAEDSLLHEFAKAILAGTPFPITWGDVHLATQVAALIETSASENRVLEIGVGRS